MNSIVIGRYLPGHSLWHKLDARSKILSTSLFVFSCFMINSWIFMAILVLLEYLVILLTKIPIGYFVKSLKPIFFFILLTFFLQVLFNHQGEIFLRTYSNL